MKILINGLLFSGLVVSLVACSDPDVPREMDDPINYKGKISLR